MPIDFTLQIFIFFVYVHLDLSFILHWRITYEVRILKILSVFMEYI
mgnify:CR=1 FL=1